MTETENKNVSVLSLFDGMACGMIAFKKLGINIDNYYAYEIDKYAIKTTQHNFPEIKELGDVFEADFTQYKGIDYLIGGSPCTFWSIAQKNNRETEASGIGWELFSQYVKALNEAKPKYFLYENNKSMSKAIYKSISDTFGFEPILINSALVSAQNRNRYYWCGIRNADGTYRKVDISQPKDKGIILKDILEGNLDRKKSRAVIGSIGRTTTREYFEKCQGQMSIEPVGKTKDGKSYCLTSGYSNGSGEKIGNYAAHTLKKGCKSMVAEPVDDYIDNNLPKRVGSMPRPNGELSQSQGFRIYDTNAKSVTIKSNSGGAGGKTGLYAIPIEFDGDKPIKAISNADGKTYIVYEVKDGLITIKEKTYPIKLSNGYYIIRKLTVRECMRLQTVPEWYDFSEISDTQAYKCLGNGWTVDVIAHILKGLLNTD